MAIISRSRRAAPMLCRFGLAGAATAVAAWTRTGEAQALAGVEVRWVAPAKCPGPDDIQTRVRRLLGTHAPTPSPSERLVADGNVVAVEGRYRLSLTVHQGSEPAVTRVFDSASCDSLAGAAAVTLALLARGEVRTDEAASRPSPGPPTPAPSSSAALPAESAARTKPADSPPAAAPPATAPADVRVNQQPTESRPVTTPSTPATPRWSAVFEAPLLAVDAGVLPLWAYGVGVGAGVRVNRLRVRMAGVLWLSQSGNNAAPYGASYQRRTGELSGCYSWGGGPFEVGPCLAASLEDVTSGGTGPDVVGGPGHVSWLTVGFAARAGWSLRRWATIFVRPGLTFTTSRPTFAIDGVGPLYQVPLVAGGVEVGCEWIF